MPAYGTTPTSVGYMPRYNEKKPSSLARVHNVPKIPKRFKGLFEPSFATCTANTVLAKSTGYVTSTLVDPAIAPAINLFKGLGLSERKT